MLISPLGNGPLGSWLTLVFTPNSTGAGPIGSMAFLLVLLRLEPFVVIGALWLSGSEL